MAENDSQRNDPNEKFVQRAIELIDEWSPRISSLPKNITESELVTIWRVAHILSRRVSTQLEHSVLEPADDLTLTVKLIEFEGLLDAAAATIRQRDPGLAKNLMTIAHRN